MTALIDFSGKQLDLIRKTVASDCNIPEFDLFIHTCKTVRLDPLRRQIYAFVFSKNDPKKRQMTIVTSIGGYRSIAERTGNYRPGRTETVFDDALKDPSTNPKGVSHGAATVYKFVHGAWHENTESAYWEEFAPLKDEWRDDQRTGRQILDPKKDGWRRMPRVMIEKCAEAKALRRAWPEDFEGLYVEDELARSHTIDLTATEMANAAAEERRLGLIGGKGALTVDWCDGAELQRIPSGQFGDKVISFLRANKDEPLAVLAWADRNRHALKEYWALDPSGALAVKKALEPFEGERTKQLSAAE